jgi:hypothetical protein
VREHLNPGGIVALNVATTPDDHRLAEAIGGTLATELPEVIAWQPLRFNQIVIGRLSPSTDWRGTGPAPLKPLVDDLARNHRAVARWHDPWTDDRAPVEWITDRMIVEFAAEGGRFEEAPLPTAP